MALSDLQAFLQQRLNVFDETLDVSPGSPVDTTVIQPVLRRLGTDPFTVDFQLFAQDRLQQEFPDLAIKDGDAVVDLLIKPAILLMDPLIRENMRVKNGQSFRDPTMLTIDEADALGANLFAARETGATARGICRIYFAQPQSIAISPANFFTSRAGLHFFPTTVQSIRVEEMLFNTEGTLYYFDVNVVAENPGEEYNVGPDELVSVANLTAAVRITNKRRFRFGAPAETAATFVGRAERALTERSLVSTRGAIAKITESFPEASQVGIVGFNDPEMHRDVLRGGGLGPIVAAGFGLYAIADGENQALTRRVVIDVAEAVDFLSLFGPVGPVAGATITVHGGFADVPTVRDLRVRAVVNGNTLDLEEQVISPTAVDLPWVARRHELTLSGIPGGILFPDGPNGSLRVPNDQVHIGGATDYYVRGTDFDTTALLLDAVVGDVPELQGTQLEIVDALGTVRLLDYELDTNYAAGDVTYLVLDNAYAKTQSLQIANGTAAGTYRIIGVTQSSGQSPTLVLDPPPSNPPGEFRWKLVGALDVELAEPKETKVNGNDLLTVQNSDVVQTASGIDFQEYGVGQGDVLRILSGPDKGDFIVQAVLSPFFQRVQVDRPLTATSAASRFTIFRANREGGVRLPLVRIEAIDLLDSSGQPTGSKVPYALPVDIQSRSFANVAHGVKEDLTDAILGIVTEKFPSGAVVSGKSLTVQNAAVGPIVVTFTGVNPLSVATMVSQINTQAGSVIAAVLDTDRVGFIPVSDDMFIQPIAGDAAAILFGNLEQRSVGDVRSAAMETGGGWGSMSPSLDVNYDVVSVLDGTQIGLYDELDNPDGTSVLIAQGAAFAPEVGRHVQVGARSLGSARLFFLEPTTIEFGPQTRFRAALDDGQVLNFLPDKTISYQKIPAPPSDPFPKDGVTATDTLTSSSINFLRYGIQPGDLLFITYIPITGTVTLTDPVASLVNSTLTISISGSPDKTIVFVNDSPSIPSTSVKRQGVADQINNAVGKKICSITASNELEFEVDLSLIIRGTGTANATLGLPLTDTSNTNANTNVNGAGYAITDVAAGILTVDWPSGFAAATRQHFQVMRPRLQRVSATTMSSQIGVAGLYYCDVELISEGTGDQYNIGADIKLSATGFVADGYWLSTEDSNLAFSMVERPILHISRTILEVGVSDSLLNTTQISGQNLQVSYARSSLVESVQDFTMSETERVINQSPLARHLLPYLVRLDLSYLGGPREDEATADIETYIRELGPSDTLDASAISQLVTGRGAYSVDHPIELIAVIQNVDRTVTVERSQDRLNTGRLAAFFPDVLNVHRKLA